MNKYHKPLFYLILACAALTSCLGGKSMATGGGGEVTGQRSSSFTEPTPYGMVQVKRGYLKTGLDSPDTLWGTVMPAKEISVDGFWMDQTEVTNSMYRQFVMWVRDSIIRERLEREFGLDLVVTNPSTNYRVTLNSGEEIEIKSAADLPDMSEILEIKEPWVQGEIILPKTMIGPVLNLINSKRGHQTNLSYIEDRAIITFKAPMANLLTDFYDQLKSATSGYASFNYELAGYQAEDLVRVDVLVAGQKMDALAVMCHRSEADAIGRTIVKKLKEVIPRQNYEVALQAAIGARIIARETIGAYRKDVTVKIHTGDRDRKAKLLEKQKRGKARMKRFGKVDIPAEAFTVMLKRD